MGDSSSYDYDQPWNPVSYFEEESEATGGNDINYSPGKLASLFDITSDQEVDETEQTSCNVGSIQHLDDHEDIDNLEKYTFDSESGIKVLDTTYDINRKAIFQDFDRLRRWQENVEKPDKDVYIESSSPEYSYEINSEVSNTQDSNINNILNIDNLLDLPNEKTPSVTSPTNTYLAKFETDLLSNGIIMSDDTAEVDELIDVADSIVNNQSDIHHLNKSTSTDHVVSSNTMLEDTTMNQQEVDSIVNNQDERHHLNKSTDVMLEDTVTMNEQVVDIMSVTTVVTPPTPDTENIHNNQLVISDICIPVNIIVENESGFSSNSQDLSVMPSLVSTLENHDVGLSNQSAACDENKIQSLTTTDINSVLDMIPPATNINQEVVSNDPVVTNKPIVSDICIPMNIINENDSEFDTNIQNLTEIPSLVSSHMIDNSNIANNDLTEENSGGSKTPEQNTVSDVLIGDISDNETETDSSIKVTSVLDMIPLATNIDTEIVSNEPVVTNEPIVSDTCIPMNIVNENDSEFDTNIQNLTEIPSLVSSHMIEGSNVPNIDLTEESSGDSKTLEPTPVSDGLTKINTDNVTSVLDIATTNTDINTEADNHPIVSDTCVPKNIKTQSAIGFDTATQNQTEMPSLVSTCTNNIGKHISVSDEQVVGEDLVDASEVSSVLTIVEHSPELNNQMMSQSDQDDPSGFVEESSETNVENLSNIPSATQKDVLDNLHQNEDENQPIALPNSTTEDSTEHIPSESFPTTNSPQVIAITKQNNSLQCLTPDDDDEDDDIVANTQSKVIENIIENSEESTSQATIALDGNITSPSTPNTQTTNEEVAVQNDVTLSTDIEFHDDDDIDQQLNALEEEMLASANELPNTENTEIDNAEVNDDNNQTTSAATDGNELLDTPASNCVVELTLDSNNESATEIVSTTSPTVDTENTEAQSVSTESQDPINVEETVSTEQDSEESAPSRPQRSSGSIRRVRFSLDAEQEQRSQESEQQPQAQAISEEDAPSSPEITEEMRRLGWYAPKWIADEEAKTCMKCDMKFTVVKRRHHCRACGKVLCSQCCNMKFHMPYMDYKPQRVCQTCCDIMVSVLNLPRPGADSSQPSTPRSEPSSDVQHGATASPRQLPEAPPPYSESIDRLTERLGSNASDAPPYSEIATAGTRYSEQPSPVLPAGQALENLPSVAQASFPGSPVHDMMNFQLPAYTPTIRARSNRNRSESEMSAVIMFNSTVTNLPPILRRNNEETRIVNNPDLTSLFNEIREEDAEPISFIVNKNLVVRVKVINMDCCVDKKCWCFASDGMGASNQEEIVVLVKEDASDIEDAVLTRKILQQMNSIFEKAKQGNPVSELEEVEFDSNMLYPTENIGMLFFKPTLQCSKKLLIPTSPYLFGLYIKQSELPWAKNFPLRLLLRIGAEFKYYPCPLFNVLDRTPVYNGVGRTILDLLADFRNFQYTIPRIAGVTINLRGKDTLIRLPQHRYDEVMKAVNAAEENVLSLAGNFSSSCDGHLVSVEKDGKYKTQTLSIVHKENRKVTCASFVVISAALKPNAEGIKAKASIVEDGVMIQVTTDVMKELKKSIKDMKEYTVTAGRPSSTDDHSQVQLEWCAVDVVERPRLLSPIDSTSFDNLTNMKIRHSYDYTSNNLTAKIHWVEVYFLPQDNDTVQRLSARELGQMTSSIAKSCMSALSPHLMTLIALEMTRIGLRVNLAADFVEYKIGANLSTLPTELLPTLDDKLVPAIHSVMSNAQERVAVELIFQVVKIV